MSLGIELEKIRWQLSMKNLSDVSVYMSDDANIISPETDALKLYSGVNFMELDIDDLATLNPLTHIYQYDLGFPPPVQQRIAEKFNTSMYAKYFISYRPPHRVIHEYGYDVEFMSQFLTSMHGSGEGHTVYFYKRLNPLGKEPANSIKVTLVYIYICSCMYIYVCLYAYMYVTLHICMNIHRYMYTHKLM
jgi:hypothetical protein